MKITGARTLIIGLATLGCCTFIAAFTVSKVTGIGAPLDLTGLGFLLISLATPVTAAQAYKSVGSIKHGQTAPNTQNGGDK